MVMARLGLNADKVYSPDDFAGISSFNSQEVLNAVGMDKENSNVRKYLAQRAELLGAIRLPNDTFKGNAGTEVVSDILFLQKRDRLIDIEPDWVHLDTDENGIRMNSKAFRTIRVSTTNTK